MDEELTLRYIPPPYSALHWYHLHEVKVAEVESSIPVVVNKQLSLHGDSLLFEECDDNEGENGLCCLAHSVKEE